MPRSQFIFLFTLAPLPFSFMFMEFKKKILSVNALLIRIMLLQRNSISAECNYQPMKQEPQMTKYFRNLIAGMKKMAKQKNLA